MPGTYSRILLYVVGFVRGEHGVLYAIGGITDHVHMLLRWRTDESVAVLLRNVKSHSTKWVKQEFPLMPDFAWQEGYGAFQSANPGVRSSKRTSRTKLVITDDALFSKSSWSCSILMTLSMTRNICGIREPAPPSGLGGHVRFITTGFAALHPWLQPAAPLGP